MALNLIRLPFFLVCLFENSFRFCRLARSVEKTHLSFGGPGQVRMSDQAQALAYLQIRLPKCPTHALWYSSLDILKVILHVEIFHIPGTFKPVKFHVKVSDRF